MDGAMVVFLGMGTDRRTRHEGYRQDRRTGSPVRMAEVRPLAQVAVGKNRAIVAIRAAH
jgi:hypothetical protein